MAEKKSTNKKKTEKTAPKGSSRSRRKEEPQEAPQEEIVVSHRREIWGIVLLALGIFMIISYFSTNGHVIAFFANAIKGMIGWGFWLAVPAFLFAGLLLLSRKESATLLRVIAALLLPLLFSAMVEVVHLNGSGTGAFSLKSALENLYFSGNQMNSGGVLGGLFGLGLYSAFDVYGAFPLLLVFFVVCLILAIRGTLVGLFSGMKKAAAGHMAQMRQARGSRSEEEEEELADEPARSPEKRAAKDSKSSRRPSFSMDIPLEESDEEELSLKGPSRYSEFASPTAESSAKKAKVRRKTEEIPAPVASASRGSASVPKVETFRFDPEDAVHQEEIVDGYRKLPLTPKAEKQTVAVTAAISDPPKPKKIRKEEIRQETQAVAEEIAGAEEKPAYVFPPIELLRSSTGGTVDARDEIKLNGERLHSALSSFGINAAIVGVTHGPTVTRYDIELEQGVKLSRVTNLAGDLALALGVVNVRIAPIPDKISTVGIEVPNKIVSTVYLRDIIESAKFQGAKSKISFALGKDIGGDCIVGNIAKLPHMLIAGTTGSGKSVCMNSLILSLLYKARPDEVRLIMIDPKMVELGVYNGIPHLYVPVVTDPKKAAGALQWSVVEMLKRYRLFSEIGVRDLESYNKHAQTMGEDTLPQVVIVIDELADLMLVASKEVEESICRVAQMGRAAGMHLVIATQRPSADVITGLMKANIPSRIAFAVSSAMESRIILDQGGAEKLVGMGDMLFSPVGSGKPTRIQGAFVSDEEREEVIQFIKDSAGEMQKNNEIEEYMNKASEEKTASDDAKAAKDEGSSASGYDEMLPQAVEAVLEAGSCSVSMLQRRVKLGYSRAARIVDQMEELGVVGPYEGAKPRSVVIDRNGWHDLQVQLGMIQDDDLALAAQMSDDAGFAAYDE